MPRLRDILSQLELIAPQRFAFSFDRVGLQVGDGEQEVTRAVVTLDRSLAAVEYAKCRGAQLLLAHHPLIFRPIESVDTRSHVGRTIFQLVRSDIAFVAAHTNWDCARGGINDTLASVLGLSEVRDFGTASDVEQYKVVVYAPTDAAETLIDKAAEAGAGVIGHYERCAFLSDGVGTFSAGRMANPAVGAPGETSSVAESRIEMVVPKAVAELVRNAIRRHHPYEEPVVDFLALRPVAEQPAGRIGNFAKQSLRALAALVDDRLATRCLTWGDPDRTIKTIAVVGGSADDEWRNAQRAGADVLITGEVKQHNALEASESGMCLISAGHYATEHPGCEALRKRMAQAVPSINWLLFTPEPGQSGRPF